MDKCLRGEQSGGLPHSSRSLPSRLLRWHVPVGPFEGAAGRDADHLAAPSAVDLCLRHSPAPGEMGGCQVHPPKEPQMTQIPKSTPQRSSPTSPKRIPSIEYDNADENDVPTLNETGSLTWRRNSAAQAVNYSSRTAEQAYGQARNCRVRCCHAIPRRRAARRAHGDHDSAPDFATPLRVYRRTLPAGSRSSSMQTCGAHERDGLHVVSAHVIPSFRQLSRAFPPSPG